MGRATVERFARAGSKVILGDLPTSKGEDVAKELGDNVIFVPVNVSALCYQYIYLTKNLRLIFLEF